LLGYSGALRETLGKPTPAAHADFDDSELLFYVSQLEEYYC